MDVNSRDPLQNIIPFRIKGVEIGRFDGSGNLGIGTATTTATAVRLDISGGAVRVNSGAAANTALTTVGRIGVNLTTSPTVDLDVSGAARVNSGSAANTALTTTGRIGVNLTTSPTVDLDVSGAARVNSGAATNTALTTTGRIGVNLTTSPTVDLDVSGSVKITRNVDMSSTGKIVNLVTPTAAQEAATKGYVDGAIPIGGIIMWSGTIATIPSNWRLCDGSNNTPDLRNKFVIGAIIDASSVAQTNITVVNTITGGTKDTVVVQHTHTATSGTVTPTLAITQTGYVASGGGNFHRAQVGSVDEYTGIGGAHSHPITVAQEGVSGTNQNLPPYYALAFIMRIS